MYFSKYIIILTVSVSSNFAFAVDTSAVIQALNTRISNIQQAQQKLDSINSVVALGKCTAFQQLADILKTTNPATAPFGGLRPKFKSEALAEIKKLDRTIKEGAECKAAVSALNSVGNND